MTLSAKSLIACHDCDLLHRVRPLLDGQSATCSRCGAILYQQKPDSLNRTLMLTVTAFILFILANTFPFMTLKIAGREQGTTLISGAIAFHESGMWGLPVLVFLTSILVPAVKILGMLYILLPLKFNRLPWKVGPLFRFLQTVTPWGMMEVYMLGVFVALVKLADLATIVPGVAIYAFGALILIMAAASTSLDPRIVWNRLPVAPGAGS